MADFNTDEPIGFLITWTVYGTWLPGDERGYVKWHAGWQPPSILLQAYAKSIMAQPIRTLTRRERAQVEDTVQKHCAFRRWPLWEVNARTTHVHAVLTAPGCNGKQVRDQLKAWCTRELKEHDAHGRQHWWAEGGSALCLNDDESLANAIAYVRDAQD